MKRRFHQRRGSSASNHHSLNTSGPFDQGAGKHNPLANPAPPTNLAVGNKETPPSNPSLFHDTHSNQGSPLTPAASGDRAGEDGLSFSPTASGDVLRKGATPVSTEAERKIAPSPRDDSRDQLSGNPQASSDAPIRQLWAIAYEKLKQDDPDLIARYEADLKQHFSLDTNATREQQLHALLKAKMEEVERNTWKLKFSDYEVPVRDLAAPVLGVISMVNEHIGSATTGNPCASFAWSGVSLLLQVSGPLFDTDVDMVADFS